VVTVEIVLLAMVALFVGLRLYSVLGRRTGHEQQPILRPAETVRSPDVPATVAEAAAERPEPAGFAYEDTAASGIRAIISADHDFDVSRFLDGAQAAYRMILEAYWTGDRDTLRPLVGDEVMKSFEEAIAARLEAGHRLDNRLVAIERAVIEDAKLDGRSASIQVRFDADIAAVTRNAENVVVAGTMSDAIPTHDIWTFRRSLASRDPNWLLVETDDAD
jgi:predicted lipid-binding transport protein (Tim44 family)